MKTAMYVSSHEDTPFRPGYRQELLHTEDEQTSKNIIKHYDWLAEAEMLYEDDIKTADLDSLLPDFVHEKIKLAEYAKARIQKAILFLNRYDQIKFSRVKNKYIRIKTNIIEFIKSAQIQLKRMSEENATTLLHRRDVTDTGLDKEAIDITRAFKLTNVESRPLKGKQCCRGNGHLTFDTSKIYSEHRMILLALDKLSEVWRTFQLLMGSSEIVFSTKLPNSSAQGSSQGQKRKEDSILVKAQFTQIQDLASSSNLPEDPERYSSCDDGSEPSTVDGVNTDEHLEEIDNFISSSNGINIETEPESQALKYHQKLKRFLNKSDKNEPPSKKPMKIDGENKENVKEDKFHKIYQELTSKYKPNSSSDQKEYEDENILENEDESDNYHEKLSAAKEVEDYEHLLENSD